MKCDNCNTENDFYIEEVSCSSIISYDEDTVFVDVGSTETLDTFLKCNNCSARYLKSFDIEWE